MLHAILATKSVVICCDTLSYPGNQKILGNYFVDKLSKFINLGLFQIREKVEVQKRKLEFLALALDG